jgi:hypothetical protein
MRKTGNQEKGQKGSGKKGENGTTGKLQNAHTKGRVQLLWAWDADRSIIDGRIGRVEGFRVVTDFQDSGLSLPDLSPGCLSR